MAKRRVLVGLPAGSGEQDGTPLVVIGAANEFGAKITIPERQATITRQVKANGEFANGGRFKKNGNFQTEHIIPAHTVTIPERSFLRVPLHQNQDNIKKAFRALTGKVTRGEITAFAVAPVEPVDPSLGEDWTDFEETVCSSIEVMLSVNFLNAGAAQAAMMLQNANFRAPVSEFLFRHNMAWRYASNPRNLTGLFQAGIQPRWQTDIQLFIEHTVSYSVLRAAGVEIIPTDRS